MLREMGETEFIRRHQCPVRSLAAFEHSDYTDDWRELMRLYMVRRTRSFIQENYALNRSDRQAGNTLLSLMEAGPTFPTRQPKTVKFTINDDDTSDQYARLVC